MADTAWFLDLDWVSSPAGSETIFMDDIQARDRNQEHDEARLLTAAALVGNSPIDALMKLT